jgi:hypothetical protein
MSKLDVIKEHISYLKVWLGISIVTLISLIGWLSSNYNNISNARIALSFLGIFWLIGLIHILNKNILNKINSLEEL